MLYGLADTYILMAALQVIVFINIRNHMQVTNRGVVFVELSIGYGMLNFFSLHNTLFC